MSESEMENSAIDELQDVLGDAKFHKSKRVIVSVDLLERVFALLGTYSEAIEVATTEAYERGKAEGREAERGRIREALEAERDSAKARKERATSGMVGLVWQEREETYDKAINIVNNPPVPIVCIECGNPPLYVYGGQGMCRECADKQRG